ncbi:UPF0716 protein FxsA [Pelagirhabdus alkalitolerans]|uniref:UPF0716 protein FxsA n=1 Tax=Pelagirhabdus alkalitolerans TaxID=1612202 RepID=A0A1G6HK52_9BACI|nr:FxsA family protein [Pelagirhabdus alkalitolerans]SDB94584.1 UPF0716 protein FxsA [Pelagirhabdus alkalitolerans]
MFKWIFLLLIIMPALEIGVFIWAGGRIGAWSVIGFIVLTGFVGATLAKQQGVQTLRKAQSDMQYQQLPKEAIFDGICILIGGIVLLTPGFITDAIGFLLLIPFTRTPLKNALKTLIQQMIANQSVMIYRRF